MIYVCTEIQRLNENYSDEKNFDEKRVNEKRFNSL